MRLPSISFAIALGLSAALLSGCGKSSSLSGPGPGSSAQEEAAATSAVAAAPEVVDDGLYDSSDRTGLSGGSGGAAAIQPIWYWRTLRSSERRFEFAFADTDSTGLPTNAIVTIHRHLLGRFNILTGSAPDDTLLLDSTRIVRKPLEDRWVRRVALHRVGVTRDGHGIWRVRAASGVKVTSVNDAAVDHTQIVSLHVQAAGLDTTITDPLAFWTLRRILKLDASDQVTLTVTTTHTDDVVVLYHWLRRFRLHNNGDGTYSGTFMAGAFPGIRHFGVNAFSNGTLFDDVAPYNSQAWMLPYVVRPTELADELP